MGKRVALVGLFVVVAGLGFWLYPSYRLRTAFAADKLRPFEELFKEHAGQLVPEQSVPPRTGKVLVMSPSMWHTGRNLLPRTKILPEYWSSYRELEPPRLHDAMFALSGSVRASDPSEVSTVILCQPFAEQIVEKSDTWEDEYAIYWMEYYRGRRRCVLLSVLDVPSGRLLGNYILAGPPPETALPDELGPPPDIAKFVEGMPRS